MRKRLIAFLEAIDSRIGDRYFRVTYTEIHDEETVMRNSNNFICFLPELGFSYDDDQHGRFCGSGNDQGIDCNHCGKRIRK